MKSTGIVRRLDDLGRISIPAELRRIHNINDRDPLEIFTNGGDIVLRPYRPGCIFCNRPQDFTHKNVPVCSHCASELQDR